MKYKEWLDIWLKNYVKSSSKQRTYEQYCNVAKIHILPYLGDIEITDLTLIMLQKYVTHLATKGNKLTGKGLAPNYVKNIVSIVQNSLKTVNLIGYINEYTAGELNALKSLKNRSIALMIPTERK